MEKFPIISKIASHGIIVLLFYFGANLLIKAESLVSSASVAGSGMIFVGITLSIVFFMDWRKREGYEHIIKQQEGVIRSLSSRLREAVKTSVGFGQASLDSFDSKDGTLQTKGGTYVPDGDNGTQDNK